MFKRLWTRCQGEVLELIRLVFLIGLTIAVAVGGYLVYERYLLQTIELLLEAMGSWWETLSIAGLWRNLVTWFIAMGRNWVLVEIPKRLAILYLVPTIVLMLLPGTWVSAIKRWLRRRKDNVLRCKSWFVGHAERWFGKYAGHAIAAILALIFFVIFYSFFSVYMVLWLGFIKLPSSVVWVFTLVWGKLVYFAQKLGFRKWAFRLTGWIGRLARRWMAPIVMRLMPDFHWFRWIGRKLRLTRQLTDEEKRQKKRDRVRWAIRQRYRNAEWIVKRRERLARIAQLRGRRATADQVCREQTPPVLPKAAE